MTTSPRCGLSRSSDWFEKTLRAQYELMVGGRLGPGLKDDKGGTVLNRVIRWTPTGIEYEADPRQVERLFQELELEGEGVKGVVTPGVKILVHQTHAEKEVHHDRAHNVQGAGGKS